MIPHNKPTCSVEEAQAAAAVVQSGWLAQGREVEAFENELCEFLGLPAGHAVALSSGTAALYMALWVLGAKERKVAFPVYACSALRNAVAMAGAREVLLDVSNGSPNVDLTEASCCGADILIAPHMYGIPINFSVRQSITVIEDCAQALGAGVGGIKTGLLGDAGIFSFYATKMMTSGGQGGMFVSKHKELVDAVRDYRQFDCRHDHKPRFNLQMTDLQATVGRVQLKKMPEFIQRRQRLFNIYRAAGLDLLDVSEGCGHLQPVRYRAVLRTDQPAAVIRVLAENDIKAIVPIEEYELLGDPARFRHAWTLTQHTVSLPIFPSLTDEQAHTITHIVGRLQ